MTRDVTLETPRLLLRELSADDTAAVQAYAGDAEVVRYLDWGPNTPGDTARFLATAQAAREAALRSAYHLAIVVKTAGRLIGGCRIEVRSAANGHGDLGFVLDRQHWGHGYATEATRALLEFGFRRLALHRIWATCDARNQASVRVLEKAGMRREGHLRQNTRPKGEWRDSYVYAILQPEWRAGAASGVPAIDTSRPAVDLQEATPSDVPTLRRLMQLYLYDLVPAAGWDIGTDGAFGDPEVIERFWSGADRSAYLIRVDGQLGGFVLLREGSYYGGPGTREVSEFFILRPHRRRGIGERAAVSLFDRFPGRWEVRVLAENIAAREFWRAVIGRYTLGDSTETTRHDARFSGVVQHFSSGRVRGDSDRAQSG